MLLQQSPFRGEDEDEIYDAILADEPLYPIHMPRDSVSILQKLLTREPEQRLGSGPTDAQEIMSQPFFRNINWDDVYHKRITPPFQPSIASATDTSNFDSEFTSVTPVLTPVQSGKLLPSLLTCLTLHLTSPQYYPKPCKKNSGDSLTPPTSSEQTQNTAHPRHHPANSTQAASSGSQKPTLTVQKQQRCQPTPTNHSFVST